MKVRVGKIIKTCLQIPSSSCSVSYGLPGLLGRLALSYSAKTCGQEWFQNHMEHTLRKYRSVTVSKLEILIAGKLGRNIHRMLVEECGGWKQQSPSVHRRCQHNSWRGNRLFLTNIAFSDKYKRLQVNYRFLMLCKWNWNNHKTTETNCCHPREKKKISRNNVSFTFLRDNGKLSTYFVIIFTLFHERVTWHYHGKMRNYDVISWWFSL